MSNDVRWPWDDAADRINRTLDGVANILVRVAFSLQRIETQQRQFLDAQGRLLMTLDDVQAKVTAEGDVVASAVTLLIQLKAKLDAAIASGDPAKIQALSDAIGAQTQTLADAVAANTPAA